MNKEQIVKGIKITLCGLVPIVIIVLMLICTPISRDELAKYKQKEAEDYEKESQYEEFVDINENYDTDYYELSERYNQLKQEFDLFKES